MDDDFSGSYFCRNYQSILDDEFRSQMDSTIMMELELEKVSIVARQPTCVHALGAVRKSDGSLWPIMGCKRPLGSSINNFMHTVCEDFHYIRIDDVTDVVTQGCYVRLLISSQPTGRLMFIPLRDSTKGLCGILMVNLVCIQVHA